MPQEPLPTNKQSISRSLRAISCQNSYFLLFSWWKNRKKGLFHLYISRLIFKEAAMDGQLTLGGADLVEFQYSGVLFVVFLNKFWNHQTHIILRFPKFWSSVEPTAKLFCWSRIKKSSVQRSHFLQCIFACCILLDDVIWPEGKYYSFNKCV